MTDPLASFIDEVCGESHLRVEDDLGDGFVRLRVSEAERRQAQHDIRSTEDLIIEMLRNSRDAHARNIFLALSREGKKRRICILDDGDGIPASLHERVFEPRVTSKLDSLHVDTWGVHGRGMALYSISCNSEKAFVLASAPRLGTVIVVETDLDRVPEKTDQSSMPRVSIGEEGKPEFLGPHNINRCVLEFAYTCPDTCQVFYGAPTEVAATLLAYGTATLPQRMRLFASQLDEVPYIKRLSTAADPEHLAQAAAGLGLDISERSARRILDGQIPPLQSVEESYPLSGTRLAGKPSQQNHAKDLRLLKDVRGLRITPEDLKEFSEQIKVSFSDLAKRYYLEESAQPEIRIGKEAIHIRIPLSKQR
ncbi:MAG: ATP-binding protein [Coriobacteriaceae bacterium]|jgi:hypothetical protein|nr:ATP-binding protein [Coriobacteriaceae bacterium]